VIWRRSFGFPLSGIFFAVVLLGSGSPAFAQGNNNNNNQNAGIRIDARGIVTPGFTADHSSKLDKKRRQALADKSLSADLNKSSEARTVSLKGLEAAVRAALDQGQPLSDELQSLAGLQRVDCLFVDPDGKDLLLVGPAEGFVPDASGRQRGVTTGRPTLVLDDLLVALRHVLSEGVIGCSIDPRPANLAALQQFVAQNSSPASTALIDARYKRMAELLGQHDIRVDGVPDESHFGRVLVEADYRMKRISLGLETPGVKGLRSHLSFLNGGGNSIQRWWFVPLYDGLYRSEDRLAFQLVGQRAQLLSQEELSNASGDRFAAATTRLSTQAFAKNFTEKFAELADESPVFAELQNLIDWCVLVELIDQEQLLKRSGFAWGVLSDAERLPTQVGPAPKEVGAMLNTKRVGSGSIIGLIAGGVTIEPRRIVKPQAVKVDPALRLDSRRTESLTSPRPEPHRWWWD
jgi:hypothetical protein